ncbi:hypothetical protein L0222_17535 [bacterium]|nr:hypothetical protein [bacterium]MCI0602882.1 hypothetical protein [bacterium]
MKTKWFLCFLIFSFVAATSGFAFTVILKTGKRIDGTWLGEDESRIQLRDQEGTVLSIRKELIDLKSMSTASRVQQSSAPKVIPSVVMGSLEINKPESSSTPQAIAPAENQSLQPGNSNVPGDVSLSSEKQTFGKHLVFGANISSSYDSNINHDSEDLVRSTGMVYGASVRFRTSKHRPSFYLDYQIAKHEYTQTDVWDRVSQNIQAIYRRDLSKRLEFLARGEIAFSGSSEDRERGDIYLFSPALSYSFENSYALQLFAAHRLKRFEEDINNRNSTNRYIGLVLEKRFGRHQLETLYRYETNDAIDPRYDYWTTTYSVQYTLPIRKLRSSFEVSFKPRKYESRTFEIELDDDTEIEVLREDKKWSFEADVAIPIGDHLRLIPCYEYETRTSNDPDKHYHAHLFTSRLVYWW